MYPVRRKIRSAGVRLKRALLSQRFGVSPSLIYDDTFYSGPGCAQGDQAAKTVASILADRYHPTTMFDFGCGHGALPEAFAALGVAASGCEGSIHGVRRCAPSITVFQADLKKPVILNRRFDLVTCIEVAEHLPASAERILVQTIAGAAERRIVFSASPPGDLGDDHINLKSPEHWARKFEKLGFRCNWPETEFVRRATAEGGAPIWYKNTIVLER